MAKKNFYAIRKGINPDTQEIVENVIFTTWAVASKYVQGVNKDKHGVSAEYKGFVTKEEAEDYINAGDPLMNKTDGLYPKDCLHCYVDGSFNSELQNYGYSLICVETDKVVHTEKGIGNNKDAVSMQQIGGELLGAIKAVLYAKQKGHKKVVIFHDYKGTCYHAIGYWDRDNKFSSDYYNWMQNFFKNNPGIEVIFCKVDAHKDDDFNNLADGFAKLSVGVKPESKFSKLIEKYGITA